MSELSRSATRFAKCLEGQRSFVSVVLGKLSFIKPKLQKNKLGFENREKCRMRGVTGSYLHAGGNLEQVNILRLFPVSAHPPKLVSYFFNAELRGCYVLMYIRIMFSLKNKMNTCFNFS